MVVGDAQLVVAAGHKGVHRRHGAHPKHLNVGVFVMRQRHQSHPDGRALTPPAAVAGKLDAVPIQPLAHCGLRIDAGNAAFQVGRRRAVDALHGNGQLDAQLLDGAKESGGVDVQAIPGFLAQKDNQPVADFVESVLPGHGAVGQALIKGCRRTKGVVGAGNLKGVAHLIDIRRKDGNLASVVLVNEIARQAAGNAAAVRPLPAPAGNEVFGLGRFRDGEKLLVRHNGPPCIGRAAV